MPYGDFAGCVSDGVLECGGNLELIQHQPARKPIMRTPPRPRRPDRVRRRHAGPDRPTTTAITRPSSSSACKPRPGYDYQEQVLSAPGLAVPVGRGAASYDADHPAVIIAKREQEQRQAVLAANDSDAQRYAHK